MRLRDRVSRYLMSMFRGTEKLNKDQILAFVRSAEANRILDCGCGDGSFTFELARAANADKVNGVELDDSRASAALERGIEVSISDLNEGLPFPDGAFDLVHSNQVIEHLWATDTLLRETHRVLKPGGIAIISTNNLSSWHNVISLSLGLQPPPAHISSEVIAGNPFDPLRGSAHPTPGDSHFRLFTFRGLREICEYHGFQVVDIRSVGYYPLPPKLSLWATRIDKWHGAFLVAKLLKR